MRRFDRDALAVEYSRKNADLNRLTGVDIYGSLGYDDVKRTDFDLIISNIPGKASEPVIAHLLREASHYLAPGGLAAVVVVAPLEATVAKILNDTSRAKIILKRSMSGHAVFHYRFAGEPGSPEPSKRATERDVYHRKNGKIHFKNLEYTIQTAYGLPEFDSLSYGSQMLMKALGKAKLEPKLWKMPGAVLKSWLAWQGLNWERCCRSARWLVLYLCR